MELVVAELLPVDIRVFFELKKGFFVEGFKSLIHSNPVPLSAVVIFIVTIVVVLCIRGVNQFSHAEARFYEHEATEAWLFILLDILISANHGIGLAQGHVVLCLSERVLVDRQLLDESLSQSRHVNVWILA